MAAQTTTASESRDVKHRRSRLPLLLTIILCCALASSFYLWERGRPVRTVKLALVTWNNDAFWDPVIRGAEDAAKEWSVDLTAVRSTPEIETQSKHVSDLLAKGVEGIAISPNNPQAQAALLNEAAAKAVLVTFDSDAPETKRRLFVGTDDYSAGALAADEVRDALPDGGSILISVGSLETVNGRDRRQGLIDALLDRRFDRTRKADPVDATLKGAKYSVAATVLDGADVGKGKTLVAEALKAHPEVACVVGLWSYSAEVVLGGIEQAGKAGGQVKVIAFDESPVTQAGIEDGSIRSSILQDQYRIGYEAVRILASAVRGLEEGGPRGPRLVYTSVSVLRQDNLETFRLQNRIRRLPPKPAAAAATLPTADASRATAPN
jgi:ribose transport system substrate-binding protein